MTTAAQKLGLSQPALTSHLKQFEGYFPQAVFTFEGRKKVLTSFGHQLKMVLQKRFEYLERDLKSLNEQFQNPEEARVRIAGRHELLSFLVYRLQFSGSLSFYAADGAAAVSGLQEHRFDLAISNHIEKAALLHGKKLFSDHFCIAVPEKWKLNSSSIDKKILAALSERPYLSYKEEDENLKVLWGKYKVERKPKVKKTISDWLQLAHLAENQEGWTILPSRYIKNWKTLHFIPIPTSLIAETQFFILYRKESFSLPWFKELVLQLTEISIA
jgi:DNA-binding transcriptional LysR family regulator